MVCGKDPVVADYDTEAGLWCGNEDIGFIIYVLPHR